MRQALTGVTAALLWLVAPAVLAAQTTDNAVDDTARYAISRDGNDVVRIDKTTGQTSRCVARDAGWACQIMPEERAAFENEIARLQDENATLKKQLADVSPPKPETRADKPGPSPKGYRVPEPQIRLPTNEDIDRAMAKVGRVWKRLVEMLNDARTDMQEKI